MESVGREIFVQLCFSLFLFVRVGGEVVDLYSILYDNCTDLLFIYSRTVPLSPYPHQCLSIFYPTTFVIHVSVISLLMGPLALLSIESWCL